MILVGFIRDMILLGLPHCHFSPFSQVQVHFGQKTLVPWSYMQVWDIAFVGKTALPQSQSQTFSALTSSEDSIGLWKVAFQHWVLKTQCQQLAPQIIWWHNVFFLAMLCASQDLQPPRSIINEINWKDIESLGKSKQDTHEEQSIRETKLEAYTARSPTYMDFQVADFRTKEPQS